MNSLFPMMIGPNNNNNDDDDNDNRRIIEVDDDEQDDNDNDNTENSATIDCTGADAGIVTAGFTVQGIYTRWWPTDKQKELFSPTDTVMPRRRLYTRPLEGYKNSSSDGNHRHRHPSEPWTGFHNTTKKNNIDDDDEEEGKEEKVDDSEEEEEEEEEEYDEYGYVRYMVPVDDDGYDVAKFAPKKGLIGGHFWHEYNEMSKTVREDRAILFQSQENYATVLLAIKKMMMMMSKKKKKKKDTTTAFPSAVGGSGASLVDDDDDDDDNDNDIDNDNTSGILNKNYMEHPTFGEQVIVSGIETHELAIGDIFKIQNENDNGSTSTSTSTLVIEITAPRKPCGIINIKHDTRPRPGSSDGLTHYVHRHKCLGGWFARVLVEGELRDGMKFIRTSHPNPKWTLTYLYRALYWEGTTNRRDILLNASSWNRSRKELLEMINLSQLGEYEWKVEGRKLLYKLDGINWKIIQPNLIDPQLDLPLKEAESLFATSATDANDPNLLQNCLFEYICNMTETYESFADILKLFGLIKLG